jgi:photosystem II stability/assembly factor-like uncharacterized protein
VGDNIYQTTDSGKSWSVIPNTPKVKNFFNLFFVDAQNGFAENTTQLAVTVDGGYTWAVKPLATTGGLTIFFVDPSTGFYGDKNGGGLKKTTDAGNSWTTIFNYPNVSEEYYPYFLNTDTGYVFTGSGTFAFTMDAGKTWITKPFILSTDMIPGGYNQLFFLDTKTGFYASTSGVWKTTDGGLSWKNVLPVTDLSPGSISYINVIRFLDRNTGYYKSNNAMYKSSDGGDNWTLDAKLNSDNFLGMYFLDVHNGWTCTSKGRVLRIQQ